LDRPALAGDERAVFGGADDALVDQNVGAAQPDAAAPRARADERAEAESAHAVGHRLTVGRSGLVDENDEVSAEGGLHVLGRRAEARLPPHPWLAHQA